MPSLAQTQLSDSPPPTPTDEIRARVYGAGSSQYLGEPVTVLAHLCQAGWLAQEAGAGDELVAAALLHDVGQLVVAGGGGRLPQGDDPHHDDRGARWLARWFPLSVTEPVRLHVMAKRYLCATEPGYREALSPASQFTLEVQGGPFDLREVRAFEALPFAADAISLRRWDDQAKDPSVVTPSLEGFWPLLESLACRHR